MPKDGRHNKLYRTPPTPAPEELLTMEQSFVLDCNAVSSISQDYSKANPKLGPVIPPYNSQKDKHTKTYFTFSGVNKTLENTAQVAPGTSIEGKTLDKFHYEGAGFQYLVKRNKNGAGNSREIVDGHTQFMKGVKPVLGYHGKFGFRRNNPWLRQNPSEFGTATLSPTH